MFGKLVTTSTLAMVLMSAGAQGALLPAGSFESPTTLYEPPAGWTLTVPDGASGGGGGVASYEVDWVGDAPALAHGDQWLYLFGPEGVTATSQVLTNVSAGLRYEVAAALGNRASQKNAEGQPNPSGTYVLALLLNGNVVASSAPINGATEIGPDDMKEYSIAYTTTAGDEGQALTFSIQYTGLEGFSSQGAVDNVRMSIVPEPASVALLTLGGAVILMRRRGQK